MFFLCAFVQLWLLTLSQPPYTYKRRDKTHTKVKNKLSNSIAILKYFIIVIRIHLSSFSTDITIIVLA